MSTNGQLRPPDQEPRPAWLDHRHSAALGIVVLVLPVALLFVALMIAVLFGRSN